MISYSLRRGVCSALLFASTTFAAAPATQPSDIMLPGCTGVATLWPNDPPATQPLDSYDRFYNKGKPPVFGIVRMKYPNICAYVPAGDGPFPAVVICPGGGYSTQAQTNEGHRIAAELLKHNIASFVLKYRFPNGHPPAADQLPLPQQDVLRAIQLVRAQAAHWHVNPKQIGVMGFSAGGHLAATAATLYDDAPSFAAAAGNDAISAASARPDFAVLAYPVISMRKGLTDNGTRANFIGADADATVTDRFSNELHVTPQTPPLFIVHAEDDHTVKIKNSQEMTAAAEKAGIPHELLTYPKGGHGFGLGKEGITRGWLDKAVDWLVSQHLIEAK